MIGCVLGAFIAAFLSVNHIFIFIRHSWFSSGDEELLVVLRRRGSIQPSDVDTCSSAGFEYALSVLFHCGRIQCSLAPSGHLVSFLFVLFLFLLYLQGLYSITALYLYMLFIICLIIV